MLCRFQFWCRRRSRRGNDSSAVVTRLVRACDQTMACHMAAQSSAASAVPTGPRGRPAGQRLDELLTQFDVPHDVKIYLGVDHGFMNDHAAQDQTLFLRFLARISGTRYDKGSTVHARRRIVAFFNQHLRPDARPSA
jgi:carboxymethylenebutenolidase